MALSQPHRPPDTGAEGILVYKQFQLFIPASTMFRRPDRLGKCVMFRYLALVVRALVVNVGATSYPSMPRKYPDHCKGPILRQNPGK